MTYETGSRGRLLADRLRVVGADPGPGRPVAAVDRDAPPATAAVRVAIVDPALDDAGRAAWAATWRDLAERNLVVPLIDLVEDEDVGPLAVIAMGETRPVPLGDTTLVDQAERLGRALATAGLDLARLTRDELGLDGDGRLLLDSVRFPAVAPISAAEGAAVMLDLLGPLDEPTAPEPIAVRRDGRSRRGRARRRIIVVSIVGLLLAAGVITVMPDRSNAPAAIVPGDEEARIDAEVLRALEETARPSPASRPPRERAASDRPARSRPTTDRPAVPAAPVTTALAPPAEASADARPDPDALPVAEGTAAGSSGEDLPLLDGVAAAPENGDALPMVDGAEGLPLVEPDGAADVGVPDGDTWNPIG